MDDPGAKLKLSVNEMMGQIIDEAYQLSSNEFVFKRFRKKVLDLGNQLVREFNEELARKKVSYKLSREELLQHAEKSRSEDSTQDS